MEVGLVVESTHTPAITLALVPDTPEPDANDGIPKGLSGLPDTGYGATSIPPILWVAAIGVFVLGVGAVEARNRR